MAVRGDVKRVVVVDEITTQNRPVRQENQQRQGSDDIKRGISALVLGFHLVSFTKET
jgi:hypothetical protein